MDGQVEGGADDEVELVPAALVPVQAGPGDHPLQQGGNQVMVSSVSSSYVFYAFIQQAVFVFRLFAKARQDNFGAIKY